MNRVYFKNTYINYFVNGANRTFWAKFFKSLSHKLQEKNKLKLHSSYDENMPIYEYYSETKKKFVRIMQFNPLSSLINLSKHTAARYYTAWIDSRVFIEADHQEDAGNDNPELVVCLLMTKDNIEKAKNLVYTWLFEDENKTNCIIKEIYSEQAKMDERL